MEGWQRDMELKVCVCVCWGWGEGVEDCGSLKLKRGLW